MFVDRDQEFGNFYAILGEVIKLMALSKVHSKWNVSDIERLVAAPIFNQRALLYYDEPDGDLVAFVSFAFLNEEQEHHYVNRTQLVHQTVFETPQDKGQLWFMDFIAPYGGVPALMRHTRSWIEEMYPAVIEAKYRRVSNGRIGRIAASRPALMN
jgi:hemolysin-activating ACP:hemolysin acyltransferase